MKKATILSIISAALAVALLACSAIRGRWDIAWAWMVASMFAIGSAMLTNACGKLIDANAKLSEDALVKRNLIEWSASQLNRWEKRARQAELRVKQLGNTINQIKAGRRQKQSDNL